MLANMIDEGQRAKEIKSAARRLIAKMARFALEDDGEPVGEVAYQSMLAKLALAQVALAYPEASIGDCLADGAPLRFVAQGGTLHVCCTASGPQHGWQIDC
jgi:hypothetical protein